MDFTDTNYTINKVDNGYIVNRQEEVDTEKDNTYSSTFTTETLVFQKWDDVLGWLKNAEAQEG